MDAREEKVGPVAILETKEGLRVAVYVVRMFMRSETHFGPIVDAVVSVGLKTDGGQYVRTDSDIPEVATIYGGREPILCSVVSGNLRTDSFETLTAVYRGYARPIS